ILLIAIATLAFTRGGLLNFYTAPSSATPDAPMGAVLGLPIGAGLIAAAIGLFRLKKWALWSIIGFFGLSVLSNLIYLGAVASHGLFSVMLSKLFEPPIYCAFEIRLGGPAIFFVGLMLIKPVWGFILQSLLLGYYIA